MSKSFRVLRVDHDVSLLERMAAVLASELDVQRRKAALKAVPLGARR